MMPNETVIAARAPTTPRTPAAWRAYAHLRRTQRAFTDARATACARQRRIYPGVPLNLRNFHERPLSAFPAHF
ncbi:hypothetical protein [Caballeronia sp. LZ031]|uniref:hypothetical protein n=1 Tax=Caballeronia sp. LZ031 TaxID=3038556 RepID=UPI0028542FA0|nr:hypothetical protein [Caballeronia sp. LZ031]MDR5839549.1 hypothetical protein [Caballeronia sp. LZ031]